MTRRWFQLPVASMLVFAVFLTVVAFPASAGRAGGRDGDGAGGVGLGHKRTTVHPSLRSTASNRNGSRQVKEEWYKREIMDYILNVTGRKNGSSQGGQTNGTLKEEEGSRSHSRRDPVQGTVPPNRTDRIQKTSVKNTWNKEKIKFNPDEVSTVTGKNDVLVLFGLHNYTDIKVDVAELVLLLRYRNSRANQSAISRKPEVRRITIYVFRDTANATSSGNASSVELSSRTSSTFQIRRTKWVKVLLMRTWIEEALSSPSRTLRLRLVYDKSDSIEVVTTYLRGRDGEQGKRNRRRMRVGKVGGDRSSQQPKDLRGNRKQKVSPVLVVMKREKRSS